MQKEFINSDKFLNRLAFVSFICLSFCAVYTISSVFFMIQFGDLRNIKSIRNIAAEIYNKIDHKCNSLYVAKRNLNINDTKYKRTLKT